MWSLSTLSTDKAKSKLHDALVHDDDLLLDASKFRNRLAMSSRKSQIFPVSGSLFVARLERAASHYVNRGDDGALFITYIISFHVPCQPTKDILRPRRLLLPLYQEMT
jgi:hypothetical protein